MLDLKALTESIRGGDPSAYQRAKDRWDSLAKPLGSLGGLETAICRIAAITGNEDISLERRRLVVFCADNGVVAQGVSQSDSSVTEAVAKALGKGCSTVNYMASGLSCEVLPIDIGMSCGRTPTGVLAQRIRSGTADLFLGPAMEREDCLRAMETGEMYASMGPRFREVSIEDGRLHVECSDVRSLFLHNGGKKPGFVHAAQGDTLTSADFTIPQDAKYIRVSLTDWEGMRADTRGFFPEEIGLAPQDS